MTAREKFHGVMNFNLDMPNMKTEFGYWAGGIRHWFSQGLPQREPIPVGALDGDLVRGSFPLMAGSKELVDKNIMPYLGLDSYLAKFPFDLSPGRTQKVLEENEHYRVFTDSYGVTKKVTKDNASIPLVIDYPIKSKKDFYRYIDLYDSDLVKRLPANFEQLKRSLKNRDFPIRLGGGPYGFSFFPRYLMGDVGFMLNMYDNPDLIKEFNEFFLKFVMDYWSLILEEFEIDCILILEDVAYRSGSMISPQMFQEFMAPYYRRFVDFVSQYGIRNIFVDCDGLVEELIPLWIGVGVTGIFPIEALNDIVKIRESYPRLKLMGGVDKRRLINTEKGQIDEELNRIIPVMKTGGYVPHIDHAVSEDISWNNFKYYREKLNSVIDHISGGII